MIKGVNKKIIEINNPESPYFDKVILYIKPNREVQSSGELSYEVDKYLKSIIKDRPKKSIATNHSLGFILVMAIVLTLVIFLILM